jgi:thymidylate synthase (FAD)
MSKPIEPRVFLIGESRVNHEGLQSLLDHLGVPDWTSDAPTDMELITEVFGRACYRSFGTELNPNITRVRQFNKSYLTNIIEKGDGSVLEHGVVNFFLADVSRVFTHELVRHRVGTAMSQESLRFVRLTDMDWYAPVAIQESEEAMTIFARTFEELSKLQRELAEQFGLDDRDSFDEKKEITSAMRRIAPIGLATNIGWSCNMRTLRHVIEQRTSPWAEEEIRLVFGNIADLAVERWPNLFADYRREMVDGLPHYTTDNRKV